MPTSPAPPQVTVATAKAGEVYTQYGSQYISDGRGGGTKVESSYNPSERAYYASLQPAQISPQEDARLEQIKHDQAFSQPRNDNNAPRSAAFNAINAQYAASRNQVVTSGGSVYQGEITQPNPYAEDTAAGIAWDVARTGGATDTRMNAIAETQIASVGGDASFIRYATDIYVERPSYAQETLTTRDGQTFVNPAWVGVPIRLNLTKEEMRQGLNPDTSNKYYQYNQDTFMLDSYQGGAIPVDPGVHTRFGDFGGPILKDNSYGGWSRNDMGISSTSLVVDPSYVPFASAGTGRLVGGNKVADAGTRIDATSPQNVEVLMAGGALPKPFRAPSENTQPSGFWESGGFVGFASRLPKAIMANDYAMVGMVSGSTELKGAGIAAKASGIIPMGNEVKVVGGGADVAKGILHATPLEKYQLNSFLDYNQYLRNANPIQQALSTVFGRESATGAKVVLSDIATRGTQNEATLYRGLSGPRAMNTIENAIASGIYTEKGIQSTSHEMRIANIFASGETTPTILRYGEGSVKSIALKESVESESLVGPGRFAITNVATENGVRIVDLSPIPNTGRSYKKEIGIGGATLGGGALVYGAQAKQDGTNIVGNTPQNVELLMAGGALPKPFRGEGVVSGGNNPGILDPTGPGSKLAARLNPEQKARLESVFQVYGHATDISLSFVASVPSALTLGLLPKASFTPFADQNRRTGLGADNPLLTQANAKIQSAETIALNSWSEQDTQYGNYLDKQGIAIQSENTALSGKYDILRAEATANTKGGYWVGDQASLNKFNEKLSTLKAEETALQTKFKAYSGDITEYNQRAEVTKKLYSGIESLKAEAFASGAYVVRDGRFVENPDMKRAYGAASDWGIGASDYLTSKIGISREKFASYDIVVGSQAPVQINPSYGGLGGFIAGEQQKTRNIENAIYGFNKEVFTNPEGLVASGISGLQLSMLTSGAGGVINGVVARGGVGSGVMSVVQRVGSNPVVTYGVPSMFVAGGVMDATENFTLPASKSSMNLGQSGSHLAAMVMGGSAPMGVEVLATANPRLSYVKTEQYDLRYVDSPSPIYPSGVGSRNTLTTTTTPFSPNLNIFGRDIPLVPQRVRGTPEIKTEMWDADIGGIVAARLQGSELYPTTGARTVTLRGEYPIFGDAPMRVTGDVRIGEMQLPRTYSEYNTMGASDARRMGISQEEATALLMTDASRVTTPTTGYRIIDVYAERNANLFGTVDWTVARTDAGMGVEFNVINRESFVRAYSQTVSGGRAPSGRIDIIRDSFGGEMGNLELGGQFHPESRIVSQLQELSRSGTGKGMSERGIVFDQRGMVVSDVTGSRGGVAIDRQAANDLIARGETASLAHSHPQDFIGDFLNLNRIRSRGLTNSVVDYITQKDYQNAPSVRDLEIMGNFNGPGIFAEYIATPRGVLRFTPDAQWGWRLFDLVSKNPHANGPFLPEIMRSRGATAEFVGQNRQWVSPTGYGERVVGTSAEMRSVYSDTTTRIFDQAIDRRAMGNPNLEFLPEARTPSLSQSGRNIGTGSGGNPSNPKRGGTSPLLSEPQQKMRQSIRKSQAPSIQNIPKGQELSKAFVGVDSVSKSTPIQKTYTHAFITTGMSGVVQNSKNTQSGINSITPRSIIQPQKIENVRAFAMGSANRVVPLQSRECVRAFRMGSDMARVQPQTTVTTPAIRFISAQNSGVIQEQVKQPMQMTRTVQQPRPIPEITIRDTPPIKPIPQTPIPPSGAVGWAPPFGGGRGSPQRGYGIRSAVATHSVGADLLGASRGSFVPMAMPRTRKSKKLGMPAFRMPRF